MEYKLSVNNSIYSLNIHKFLEILEILLQTWYNKCNRICRDAERIYTGNQVIKWQAAQRTGRTRCIKASVMRFRGFLPVSAGSGT